MKFFHLSDLHLGKRLNEYSLIDDQRYILDEILRLVDVENPSAVIIAGDVYDKPTPSAGAVELFDYFICALAKKGIKIFIISGNHDSAERLSFAGKLLENDGVFISKVYDGKIAPVTLSDEFGEVNFYLLPFIKPASVRAVFPFESVENYTDAVAVAVNNMGVDYAKRNILVSHQFVTDAKESGSETVSVGGADNADVKAFGKFDYIALGHIHGAQNVKNSTARYSGTPLKYSFSESEQVKTLTVVNLGEKGDTGITEIPLKAIRDLVKIRGEYATLMNKTFYEGTNLKDDYVHITLTDEEDIPEVISKLRTVYKNVMKLEYDNTRTRKNAEFDTSVGINESSPEELFGEFFALQNNKEMSDEQKSFVESKLEETWGEEK